jgi:hypothetical protein
MIKEAIDRVLEIASPTTFQINGKTYSSKRLYQVYDSPQQPEQPVKLPVPEPMRVTTLNGLADLIQQNIEKFDLEQYLIHVVDHRNVKLVSKVSDECGRRQVLIEASPVNFTEYQFGKWLDQESFVIAVTALFADTPDREYVLKVASAMTTEATSLSEDDGVSQKVTIKAGLGIKENVEIKRTVSLAPYRTFPECHQPISDFVFRARGGESPTLMLTEADGGKWQIAAIDEVARFIRILDIKDIPVIS